MSILTNIWPSAGYIILGFLFVLSLVVFFHELGHFLIGRWCGVKVDTFSLGFGPELFGFNDRHGTHWRVAAFPLGGYVKFHGDANGASMTDEAALAAMPPGERAVSFIAQNVWKRAAIVAAGPLANFLLAIVIFTGIFYVNGRAILLPTVDGIAAGSAAEAAGFQLGDRIVSIDGIKVDSFEDMQRVVQTASDTELVFGIDRGGKLVELVATPRRRDVVTPFGTTRVGVLGVQSKSKPENWHVQNYGFVGLGEARWVGDLVCRGAHRQLSQRLGWPGRNPPINSRDRSGSPRCPARWLRSALRHCSTLPQFCRFRSEC